MQGFFDFVKSLGAARMAAMAAVTLALIGFFSFLMIHMTTPQMVPLFTDLSLDDSAAIAKDLDRQGVAYEIKNNGAIILVPRDKVARLRMKEAENGLPKGGGVGYEIFDKSDALGATSFIQNINKLRALEGELARTIRSLDRVEAARVHLVLPDRPLFSRETAQASASIVLKVNGTLRPSQVRAIRHLVASAVRGLKPERVSVVDETGKLLADGAGDDNARFGRRRRRAQDRLREPPAQRGGEHRHLGGRPRPRARADQRRLRPQPHHPDLRQIRPGRPRGALEPDARGEDRERGRQWRRGLGRQRTAGRRQDRRAQRQRRQPRAGHQRARKSSITRSPRTTKTEVTEAGRVNRISAAVLVDGTYTKDAQGKMVYKPRSKQEIDRIAALVRSAIGFDAKRGDQVEVVNLRFAETPPMPINEPTGWMSYLQFTKDDIMRAANLGVMALLGLIVLLMVVRPLVRRIITPDWPAGAALARRGRCDRRTGAAGGGAGGDGSAGGGVTCTAAATAASPRPAAPTSRSSAATKRSPSPTAPRR